MNDLFKNIAPKDQEKILQALESITVNYKKNNIIEPTERTIGIVLDGCIQINKIDYNGNTSVVEEIKRNEIFDSLSHYFSLDEYIIHVKEDSKITIFEFNSLFNILNLSYKLYQQLLKNMLLILSEKNELKNERIEILTNKTIRNKLLTYFKISANKTKSRVIYLPFNFSDLANYLAVDRSAMNRELKHLKDEGFIEIKTKKIKLLY